MMFPRANDFYPAVYPLPLLDGCVLNLDMQDTGSKLIDQSERSNHGINSGSTSVAGHYGYVRNFDGVDDLVRIPHNTSLNPTTTMTIEAWINPSSITHFEFPHIYRKEDATNRYLLSFQDTGITLAFGIAVAGVYAELDVTINSADYINQWTYIVATYDGTAKRLYRNAVQIGTQAASGSIGSINTSDAYIGTASTSQYFKGKMGEFRLRNIDLSESEIKQIFQSEAWKYGISA